jgi:hypothetical protein
VNKADKQFQKDFLKIFGNNSGRWPFPLCLDVKRMIDRIRRKSEKKVKTKCLFKNAFTGKSLSDSCPICEKYTEGGENDRRNKNK